MLLFMFCFLCLVFLCQGFKLQVKKNKIGFEFRVESEFRGEMKKYRGRHLGFLIFEFKTKTKSSMISVSLLSYALNSKNKNTSVLLYVCLILYGFVLSFF